MAAGTGLATGGNLVNLPFSALPNALSNTPAGGIAFGLVGTRFNINLALQALAQLGKTRTLAHPEIVTVENNKATFSLGEEIPYATVSSAGTQVQFKEAVLRLEVTPTVIRENIDGREIRKVKMIGDRGEQLAGRPHRLRRGHGASRSSTSARRRRRSSSERAIAWSSAA